MTPSEFETAVIEAATIAGWRHLATRRSVGRGRVIGAPAGFPDLLLWRPADMVAVWLLDSDDTDVDHLQAVTRESLDDAGVDTIVWRPADWPDTVQGALHPRWSIARPRRRTP